MFDPRDMATQGLYPGRAYHTSVANLGHWFYKIETVIGNDGRHFGRFSRFNTAENITLPSIPAHVTLSSVTAELIHSELLARAGVSLKLTSSEATLTHGEIYVTASSTVTLAAIKLDSKVSNLVATGRHDMTDEELAQAILELLDD